MKVFTLFAAVGALLGLTTATILQNGQVRITNYSDTQIDPAAQSWRTYPPNATELSYKGRWDSKFISWWSVPGLKFGFTGTRVAIGFGNYTSDGTLLGYRLDGEDWLFTNVTANSTHLLIDLDPITVLGSNSTTPSIFELRVTNWAYGVQIASVAVAPGEKLVKIPDYSRTIEVIGDSLSAGQYATLEGLASYSYGLGAGLGNTEYSITAYPGICLYDKLCYANPRGQAYQWFYTSDTSGRAIEIWGDEPEPWDFSKHAAADIVIINLGTNDANANNNVTSAQFVEQYTELIEGIHVVWPKAQIIVLSLWMGFSAVGNTYEENSGFAKEIFGIVNYFNSPSYLSHPLGWDEASNTTKPVPQTPPFVHYFNTTGILQHNDIAPQYHPTDVGHVKVASHLIQYIKLRFGWDLYATGPEVQSQTLYWNDEQDY